MRMKTNRSRQFTFADSIAGQEHSTAAHRPAKFSSLLFRSLLIALLFLPLSAGAQGIKLGVKGGIAVDKLTFNREVFNTNNRLGFFVGPILKVSAVPGWGADLSALYSETSANLLPATDGAPVTTLKHRCVLVPLNLRYTVGLGSGNGVSLFVFGGPQAAFPVGNDIHTFDEARHRVKTWRLRDSAYSLNLGAGLRVLSVEVTAHYNQSLGRTGDVEWSDAPGDVSTTFRSATKLRGWQLALTYYF